MIIIPPKLKDVKKGSGFGRIVKSNENLRANPA